LCAAAVLASGLVILAASEAAANTRVDLAFEAAGAVTNMLTPLKILGGGKSFQISGSQGNLSVGGNSVPIAGAYDGRASFYLGLDCDGNGTVDRKEYVRVGRDAVLGYQIILPNEERYAFRLVNLRMYRKLNTVSSIYGDCVINGCMKGTAEGQEIRLIDDNLDGMITQDGKDAIALGRSQVAIPLMKIHRIGSQHCELDVSRDGKSVTVSPLSDAKVGIVEVPIRAPNLKCLVCTTKTGESYDFAASGKTGVPAGDYRLSFGALVSGREMVVMKPTKTSLTYPIQAEMINRIRIGKPVRVDFSAECNKVNKMIGVSPSVRVLGAGDELYSLAFTGPMGTPRVSLAERGRLLCSEYMGRG